ncbi:hypothetical protein KFK09_018518 [Dendrobium nobile]|uniref:Uncharacterized protein n=1 Tax=Dendrobium nobile TaxID=94219 RepID=A0A8T3AUK5_DENNO|nr:hypothetical protein KFK09_018518 [Dendrobium nobile]
MRNMILPVFAFSGAWKVIEGWGSLLFPQVDGDWIWVHIARIADPTFYRPEVKRCPSLPSCWFIILVREQLACHMSLRRSSDSISLYQQAVSELDLIFILGCPSFHPLGLESGNEFTFFVHKSLTPCLNTWTMLQ